MIKPGWRFIKLADCRAPPSSPTGQAPAASSANYMTCIIRCPARRCIGSLPVLGIAWELSLPDTKGALSSTQAHPSSSPLTDAKKRSFYSTHRYSSSKRENNERKKRKENKTLNSLSNFLRYRHSLDLKKKKKNTIFYFTLGRTPFLLKKKRLTVVFD